MAWPIYLNFYERNRAARVCVSSPVCECIAFIIIIDAIQFKWTSNGERPALHDVSVGVQCAS